MFRFCDSFSHYNTAQLTRKWNSASNATVIPSGGRLGAGAVQLSSLPTSYILKTLDAQAKWIVGFAINCGGLPSTNTVLVQLLDAGTAQVELRINMDGTLSVTRNGAALSGGTSTFALRMGGWYYVEFKVTIANSISANTCQVRVNGSTVLTVATSQDTQNTANATANAIQLSGAAAGSLMADVVFIDGQSGTCTDFIGDVSVLLDLPNAAGDSTQWSVANAANNWSAVANNPSIDDSEYVYSSTTTQVDLYNLANLTIGGTIYAIQTVFTARKDDSGTRSVASAIKTGGTIFVGTTNPLTTSYTMYAEGRELNPNTGVAWTESDLTSLQAGIKLIA